MIRDIMEFNKKRFDDKAFKKNKTRSYLKGQYFSFDAIIATVIFILALISLLSYWHSLRSIFESQGGDIISDATRISELLLTPGYPQDADSCDNMEQLGLTLSWSDKRINATKLACAEGLDKDTLRAFFNTRFKLSIRFSGVDKTYIIGENINLLDQSQLNNIVKVRRVVSILHGNNEEELASMDVFVYE